MPTYKASIAHDLSHYGEVDVVAETPQQAIDILRADAQGSGNEYFDACYDDGSKGNLYECRILTLEDSDDNVLAEGVDLDAPSDFGICLSFDHNFGNNEPRFFKCWHSAYRWAATEWANFVAQRGDQFEEVGHSPDGFFAYDGKYHFSIIVTAICFED